MAKHQENKISNEEIEAMVEEFSKKLEILRVRYEQYFMGIEKTAPAVMRMDVARIMRNLEQMNVKNTALKFKIRQCIQKFTSYSTYWNRILREIEDGTYKRHIDKVKRQQAAASELAKENSAKPVVADAKKTQAVSDEAEAFLASLGLGSPSPKKTEVSTSEPAPVNVSAPTQSQRTPKIRRPAIVGAVASPESSSSSNAPVNPSVSPQKVIRPSIIQPAEHSAAAAPANDQPARPAVIRPAIIRPAIVQSAKPAVTPSSEITPTTRPVVAQPAATKPVASMSSEIPKTQPAVLKPLQTTKPAVGLGAPKSVLPSSAKPSGLPQLPKLPPKK